MLLTSRSTEKVMLTLVLGTVTVIGIPAQASDQRQPGNSSTNHVAVKTGITFSSSPTQNVGVIPAQTLIVENIPGFCQGSLFVPSLPSEFNSTPINIHSATGNGFVLKSSTIPPSSVADTKTTSPVLTNPSSPSLFTFLTHSSTTEGELKATFISSTTPPSSGLRVRIENVTPGMEGVAPYSDREYDEGGRSEEFTVRFDKQHNGAYLAVGEGDNKFTYQIKRGDQIVESGTFIARIDRQVKTETRSISLAQKSRECQQLNLPSTNLHNTNNLLEDGWKTRRQIEQDLEKLSPSVLIRPPQQLPIQIPRTQIPPIQIQQNFQSPRLIPPTPSPILTSPVFQR